MTSEVIAPRSELDCGRSALFTALNHSSLGNDRIRLIQQQIDQSHYLSPESLVKRGGVPATILVEAANEAFKTTQVLARAILHIENSLKSKFIYWGSRTPHTLGKIQSVTELDRTFIPPIIYIPGHFLALAAPDNPEADWRVFDPTHGLWVYKKITELDKE